MSALVHVGLERIGSYLWMLGFLEINYEEGSGRRCQARTGPRTHTAHRSPTPTGVAPSSARDNASVPSASRSIISSSCPWKTRRLSDAGTGSVGVRVQGTRQ